MVLFVMVAVVMVAAEAVVVVVVPQAIAIHVCNYMHCRQWALMHTLATYIRGSKCQPPVNNLPTQV